MANYFVKITNILWSQSWQLALLIAVVAVVSWALKNKSAHVRYLLWLIVLAKCLVPPFLTVPLAILPAEQRVKPLAQPILTFEVPNKVDDHAITIPSISAERDRAQSKTSEFSLPSVHQVLGTLWIIGVVVFGCVAIAKALRSNLRLRQQRNPLPNSLRSSVEQLLSGFGMKAHPKVWLLNGVGQPFVWGLLRGDIYLPTDYLKIDNAVHRRDILGHEVCHILRFDAAVNSLQIMAQAIFWFHPLVWWANQKTRMEREKCCDEMAVAHLKARAKEYSAAIVKALITEHESIWPLPSLAVAGLVKDVEERIRTMLKPGKKFYKRPTLVAATVVVLIALLTVPTALVLTARAGTKATPTPLHQAVAAGDIERVKSLSSEGANVNAKDEKGNTPLHLVARYGFRKQDIAELLIAKGADVNAKNKDGWTSLHYTAWRFYEGHRDIARLLITGGSDIQAKDKDGYMPLHYAAAAGSKGMVELLLANGSDINSRVCQGWIALHQAVSWAKDGVVEILLVKGTDVNAKDNNGRTPLHEAAAYRSKNQVEMLIAGGANINAKDSDGCTPLHIAALRGVDETVEALLARRADVNAKANSGATPLLYAAHNGKKGVVEILLAKGANINAKTDAGDTPASVALQANHQEIFDLLNAKGGETPPTYSLCMAVVKGNLSEVRSLIEKGANVNAKDWLGWTALHYAAKEGNKDMIQLLVSRGAKVNVRNKEGLTPLHLATEPDCVESLIVQSADVNVEDNDGRAPLHYAAQEGLEDVAEVLIDGGANVNPTNPGRKPLHWAVMRGHTNIVKLLIEKGADVNTEDSHSDAPLHYAVWSKRKEAAKEIAGLLLDNGANPDARDNASFAPLHYAAGAANCGSTDMVELLISKGADINLNNGWGGTALSIAKRKGHQEIDDLLRKHGSKE